MCLLLYDTRRRTASRWTTVLVGSNKIAKYIHMQLGRRTSVTRCRGGVGVHDIGWALTSSKKGKPASNRPLCGIARGNIPRPRLVCLTKRCS